MQITLDRYRLLRKQSKIRCNGNGKWHLRETTTRVHLPDSKKRFRTGHSLNAPDIPFHRVETRGRAISTALASETQQRNCHCTRGRARGDRQPSSLLPSHLHERWPAPGLDATSQELHHHCLRGPVSAHFIQGRTNDSGCVV